MDSAQNLPLAQIPMLFSISKWREARQKRQSLHSLLRSGAEFLVGAYSATFDTELVQAYSQARIRCCWLGNDAGYSVAHSRQQISNTACNNTVLRLKCDAACVFDVAAEHMMHFSAENGTIRSQNVY